MIALNSPAGEAFSRFARQVERLGTLGRAEEAQLARRARNGDSEARDRLVLSHLRLVIWVCSKHRRYGFPTEDLVSEGTLGLLEALNRFDPDRGLRFNTYAVHWIRAYVVRYILRNWRVVRVGSSPRHSLAFFRLHRERVRLEALLGDPQQVEAALATEFGSRPDRLRGLEQRWTTHDVSLDAPTKFGRGLHDRLLADHDPESAYAEQEERVRDKHRVREALLGLDARECLIVERRLMADEPSALRVVAAELGLSRERVRQLEMRARQKLFRALA